MNELFRFVALRAPERAQPSELVNLSSKSPFQKDLEKIHQPANPTDPAGGSLRKRDPNSPFHGMRARRRGRPATAGATVDSVGAARGIAEKFVSGGYGDGFIPDTYDLVWEESFQKLFDAAKEAKKLSDLQKAIKDALGASAQDLVADTKFQTLKTNVSDTIVALFIDPSAHSIALADLTLWARMIALIERVASADKTLDAYDAIQAALTATLLLPATIFPLRDDLPQPVGMGDLLVVKQQLKRYEPGDIANIENILRGESRKKFTKHALTLDNTVTTTTSKATETTNSLDVTERFELKTEVENTVKEDLSVNAGVSVSAKYGGVEINANANAAYSLSKSQSAKVATDHAKDVTSRAAKKVTESIQRTETRRTIEKFLEGEDHAFENTSKDSDNVSGVYQWMNKVYEAQVFNYGSRLLFDLTIPEPAAFILTALQGKMNEEILRAPEPFALVNNRRPVTPSDLGPDGFFKPGVDWRPLTPADLQLAATDPFYYGHYVAKYGAIGVNAPPEPVVTVSKALNGNQDNDKHLSAVDTLNIPQGYQIKSIQVEGGFSIQNGDSDDGDERLWVFVGDQKFECKGEGGDKTADAGFLNNNGSQPLNRPDIAPRPAVTLNPEQGTVPIAVESYQARDFAIAVKVQCERTAAALEQWLLDTHATIFNAYNKLMADYQDKLTAQKMQNSVKAAAQSLGVNPAQNRIIERTEIKKACIARLSATDLYQVGFNDINTGDPNFPRPNVPPLSNPKLVGSDQAAFIRFFEQAFEWEHIMYIFYPYYWSRSARWHDSSLLDNPDPLFAEFLKAGSARVVIPVRPQLEGDVRYFLMTGQIWGGGAMPEITDTDYLPITEEIKARDNAPGEEKPQGDPWDVLLPTALIRLRADDTLPVWNKFALNDRDFWVEGQMVKDKWVPDYGKVDANGNWSPK